MALFDLPLVEPKSYLPPRTGLADWAERNSIEAWPFNEHGGGQFHQ